MFEDPHAFDPSRNSKVPLKRTPLALALRMSLLTVNLLFSPHPLDCVVWYRSMLKRRVPLSYPLPWITFDATRAIQKHLSPRSTMFEFGGGNSTLYWAQRCAAVHTVEGDLEWYAMLDKAIRERKMSNIFLMHEEEKGKYANAINASGQESYDVVVVDGDFRRECIHAAVPRIKRGGLLIVDNTDWHWFRNNPIAGIPSDWKFEVFQGYAPMIGHRSETTLYKRPD